MLSCVVIPSQQTKHGWKSNPVLLLLPAVRAGEGSKTLTDGG